MFVLVNTCDGIERFHRIAKHWNSIQCMKLMRMLSKRLPFALSIALANTEDAIVTWTKCARSFLFCAKKSMNFVTTCVFGMHQHSHRVLCSANAHCNSVSRCGCCFEDSSKFNLNGFLLLGSFFKCNSLALVMQNLCTYSNYTETVLII